MNEKLETTTEKRMPIEKELIKAGERKIKESSALLDSVLSVVKKEKEGNEGRISNNKNISDIGLLEGEKVSEGAVTITRVGNDARIVVVSDIHGCIEDLNNPDGPVNYFTNSSTQGETYISFNGDIGTGPANKIKINETLATLKSTYPREVNLNSGNADRRSISLFNGLQIEIVQKFCPELFEILDKDTKEILRRLYEEQGIENIDKRIANPGFEYNNIFAARFVKAARESGAENFELKDLDFLYQCMRASSGINFRSGKRYNKKTETPMVFAANVLRPLREALEQTHKERNDSLIKDEKLKPKILETFNYWRKQNEAYNEQPIITVYENDNTVVICSHSGYVKEMDNLGDLVDNEEFKTKATWNQYLKDEVTKMGEFDIYNKDDLGKFLGKFVPSGKNILLIAGHNHGNKIEDIRILGGDGSDLGNLAKRVEVCSGSIKNPHPKYLSLDLSKIKLGGIPEEAIEFRDTK